MSDTAAHAFDPDSTPDPHGLPEISTKMLDPLNVDVLPPGEAPDKVKIEKENSDAAE